MVYLPMDILSTCILPRLPAKSLVRFKCVSKSFKRIISSPYFIDYHRNHSPSPDANRLVVLVGYKELYVYNLDHLSPYFELPHRELFAGNHSRYSSVVSCQSFVLISHGDGEYCDLTLVNPSTRTNTRVSNHRPPSLYYAWSLNTRYGFTDYIGLGYDEENNDYKIVKLRSYPCFESTGYRRQLFIYSFNSDSWRKIEEVVTGGRNRVKSISIGATLMNNHLMHWLFHSSDEEQSAAAIRIGCFDVCSEQWIDDVPLPESVINSNLLSNVKDIYADLVVFEECLCFLVRNKVDKAFDVWVMKEYGVQSSWFKLVTFPFSCIPYHEKTIITDGMIHTMVYPISYHRGSRNEILFYDRTTGKIFSYNIGGEIVTKATEFDGVPHLLKQVCMFKGRWGTPSYDLLTLANSSKTKVMSTVDDEYDTGG